MARSRAAGLFLAILTAAPAHPQDPSSPLPLNPPGVWDPASDALAAKPYATGEKAAAGAAAGGRTRIRTLASFEDSRTFDIDGKPIPYLMEHSEEIDLVYVRDAGVTDGLWCARATVAAGKGWGTIILKDPKILSDWSDYDYFALDLTLDDDHPYPVVFELLDSASRNYPTRCTFEGTQTRKGRQTLLWPIDRCKRNNKEGREWRELEPKDKIDMKNLKAVKIIVTPRADRHLQFWIDNVRLMQADAAVPRMRAPLPSPALAYDFGSPGSCVAGFTAVPASLAYPGKDGCGFVEPKELAEGGQGWPDPLSGTFVLGGHNASVEFRADVPPGDYRYWLLAGPVIPSEYRKPIYHLSVNGMALRDERPSFEDFDGPRYVHRFLWTQYSERPHAVWLDYLDRMYPVHTGSVSAPRGSVTVKTVNHFLSALILVPGANAADFDLMAAKLRKARLDAFEALNPPRSPRKPERKPGDGDYLLYVPDPGAEAGPDSGPSTDAERARRSISSSAAAGQNVIWRTALVPFRNLGPCELRPSDLRGPEGIIPASAIRGHFQNYRYGPRGPGEMILLPTLALRGEAGITQHFWLWLAVPAEAKPGVYRGNLAFTARDAEPTSIPLELTVLPFRLDADLPGSFGLYGGAEAWPRPPDDVYLAGMSRRYEWMRRAGFTATACGPAAHVTSVDGASGKVVLRFDDSLSSLALTAGLGSKRSWFNMVTQLGIARAISRRLQPAGDHPAGAPVDRNPGVEFDHPRFKSCWMDAMRQYRQHLEKSGMAYAIEIVDEPREVPNPWNRNLKHTCLYGDWLGEAGFTARFVTPMGDGGPLDYTELVNHADIVSIHAGEGSAGLMRKTLAAGKTLWFYNTGMSRFLWGVYPWRCGAKGRWEWHWCAPDGAAAGGYPGDEWFNPFTPKDGYACSAPWAAFPGGFLYKSSLLTAADGITDYATLTVLEAAVGSAKAGGAKASAVSRAEALLGEIRRAVPEFPHGDGARAAEKRLDEWRSRAGLLIAELRN